MKTLDQLFLEYQREEYGREVLFSDKGFIVIEFFSHGECLIVDFFVNEDDRGCGEAKRLYGEVLKRCLEEKASHVTTILSTNENPRQQKKCTKMARVYALLGFEICGAKNDQVIMIKRLGEKSES
jgi:GNAT superfamily N-acetyltransferase